MGNCGSQNQVVESNRQGGGFPPGEKYFIQEKVDNRKVEGGTAKIVLYFSLKLKHENVKTDVSNVSISVSLGKIGRHQGWDLLGISNCETSSLNFIPSYGMKYYFERNQLLNIEIRNRGVVVAKIDSILGKIIGSRGQLLELSLENYLGFEASLIIHGTEDKQSTINKAVDFYFNANFINPGQHYAVISNHVFSKGTPVYKTTEVNGTQFSLTTNKLNINDICKGEEDRPISFDFYNIKNHLGNVKLPLTGLNNNMRHPVSKSGDCLINYKVTERKRFINLLEQGLQVSLIIGIDFTASNGIPTQSNSLHYMRGSQPNFYEQAIRACGTIVAYYDYDQRFPVFGYGAELDGLKTVNHCFNLNYTNDPFVDGVDGVISTYRNSFTRLNLSGPTYFAPLINNVGFQIQQEMQRNSTSIYYILLIITDGAICDMDDTIESICKIASLPVSIIIIGVGDADFFNMATLDGDGQPLMDKSGKKIERDIVQFVCYNRYKDDPEELAAEVLFEVPIQVEQYYERNNFIGI